ncbi:galectin-5-like [Rhynchocyon petersi]
MTEIPDMRSSYCLLKVTQMLPYVISIPGGLHLGKSIVVTGTVLSTAYRFCINLCHGNDIAFHLNPRFDENVVVCNTLINNTWGTEELYLSGCLPFTRGVGFMVLITCEDHGFRVSVDGEHLFDYHYRIKDLLAINTLEVNGDIQDVQAQA